MTLVVILLLIEYTRSSEFRTAAAWHRANGNIFFVDGHKITLPQDWWEKDERDGGRSLAVKASRDLTHISQSGITVHQKGVEESKRNEEEIRKTLESIVQNDRKNGNNLTHSSLVVVRATSTNMYCLKTFLARKELELRCNVIGAPIVLASFGPPETEHEIESILSTFD